MRTLLCITTVYDTEKQWYINSFHIGAVDFVVAPNFDVDDSKLIKINEY